jgi:hypothetical protein
VNNEKEQALALKAALLPPDQALPAWDELLQNVPFDEIRNTTIRAIPAIYENLKYQKGVKDINRLRGAYRHAWINNTEFITTLIPILRDLATSNIDYRVLKGTALNFLFSSLGLRTMGDMDLIFRQASMEQVSKMLISHGFEQVFSSSCPHRGESPFSIDSSWINRSGIEIDLHIVEQSIAHGPVSFFRLMMDSDPEIIKISGTVAKLPSPELLLIHAVYHGDQRVAPSDQIQSLMDCSRLVRIIDPVKLEQFCLKENCGPLVQKYLDYIYSLIDIKNPISISHNTLTASSYYKSRTFFTNIIFHSGRLPNLITGRKLTAEEFKTIWFSKKLIGFRYKLWLSLLQLRLIERLNIEFFGGFLRKPEVLPDALLSQQINKITRGNFLKVANCQESSQEWRGKICFPANLSRVFLRFESEALKKHNFLIFGNGNLLGVSTRNRDGLFEVNLSFPSLMEFSLRSPVRSCLHCRPILSDVMVYTHSVHF